MGKIKRSRWLHVVIITSLLLFGGVSSLFATIYQQVVLVPSAASQAINSSITVSVRYSTSDGVKQLTGVGFRIYFDSKKLDFTGSSNLFSASQIGADTTPQNDTANEDGDASTDKYLGFAWADLSGSWPGNSQTFPLELIKLGFTVKSTAVTGTTPFKLSFTSSTAGYQGQATNSLINIIDNASVSSPNAVISDMTFKDTISGSPANYTPQTVVSFKATGVVSTANFSITYSSLPVNRVFYKVVNGQWKQIYPTNQTSGITNIALIGNTLSFTIADNSDCDSDPEVGVISDPIVVGSETSSDAGGTAPVQTSSGGGGGCFIATAAYGSYLDPHVKILRNFRDAFLLTNHLGQSFVAWYYNVSPPIADSMKANGTLKAIVRIMLFPAVGFAYLCLNAGVVPGLLIIILATAIICIGIRRLYRFRYSCQR